MDDEEGAGFFSITEREKGKPHIISFDIALCLKIIAFLEEAKKSRDDIDLGDTLRTEKSTIIMKRGSNSWGWFVHISEWKKDRRNEAIIVPAALEFLGWSNMALVLRQMLEAKKKVKSPPKDHISTAASQGNNLCCLDMDYDKMKSPAMQ